MSSDTPFQCPVCRAKQALTATCRRCRADLSLVVKVQGRIAYLLDQCELACQHGDERAFSRLTAELRWLAPATLGPDHRAS